MSLLDWPLELANQQRKSLDDWRHADSNIVLDLHGDPINAKLTVLSDGNHHMALEQVLQVFVQNNPNLTDIFYATLPPNLIKSILHDRYLQLGNLHLTIHGDVVISPEQIVNSLAEEGFVNKSIPFMKNRGSVLLVRKGNPKNITQAMDLLRADVRLFISNPITEKVSHLGYRNSLINIFKYLNEDHNAIAALVDEKNANVMYGEKIHHREAPQALVDYHCDVAILYYHLALRYVRVFPNLFELIPLGGTVDAPDPYPGNQQNRLMIGVLETDNVWKDDLVEFLLTSQAKEIYQQHGLAEWGAN